MNKELLKQVKANILSKPQEFDMGSYMGTKDESGFDLDAQEIMQQVFDGELPRCGTTCCIAGEAVFISGEAPAHEGIHDQAAKLLGLTPSQSAWLFLGGFVPSKSLNEIIPQEAVDAIDKLLSGQV